VIIDRQVLTRKEEHMVLTQERSDAFDIRIVQMRKGQPTDLCTQRRRKALHGPALGQSARRTSV
jgi:hypothetical protein